MPCRAARSRSAPPDVMATMASLRSTATSTADSTSAVPPEYEDATTIARPDATGGRP